MNYINGLFVPIPVPVVNLEQIPLPVPSIGHESALHLYNQIPNDLKLNGFGYYMRQYDSNDDMPEYELYWSYLANYYYFNRTGEFCSFYDWQEQVAAKVGGYRSGHNYPDYVDWIVDEANAGRISFEEAARQLFTRRQLMYYGW
jgi:hypothetical protein